MAFGIVVLNDEFIIKSYLFTYVNALFSHFQKLLVPHGQASLGL